MVNNDVVFDENGDILDCLSGKVLKDTPEERVRQRFINILQTDYGYPKNQIAREIPLQQGSKILTNTADGSEIRADIVVYVSKKACLEKDQGNILFVVECKKPNVTEGYAQLVSYIFNTSAVGGVWTNGDGLAVYKKKTGTEIGLDEILSLPRYREDWNGDDVIPSKFSLPRPHNVRFLLSSCHNKLYGRGMENEDFDLAMDMVRILLAKIQDETTPGDFPRFWITETDFKTVEGRKHAADTIQQLFREYMGDAYEFLIKKFADLSKKNAGEFYTPREVVRLMIRILDPDIGEHALDPAGGSGGFATSIFRYLRRKVIANTAPNSPVRDRQLATIKDSVYLVEIAARLVKIAKCAMLLTGDGQSGMTRGNSLDIYSNFDPWIVSRCAKGKSNAPSVIATNPPFSGQKVESQISDKTLLKNFTFGHSFKKSEDGRYYFSSSDSDILQHQAPELLFLERCIDWLKPGGRMGIVLPKGILDNVSYEAYRQWLLERCEIAGVVTLHKDTFQPDTGVRTCILFINKPEEGASPRDDYGIFMAMSQRIGQDSKGNSVFVLDGNGNKTDELNHDLNEIANAFIDFKHGNEHPQSEYVFSIRRSDIKDHLNINPQHYSPKLNAALDAVLEYDNKDGWATTTVGQLEAGIRIYIGPRWNSASIKVDNPTDTSTLMPYLTANAALELRRFTIKWLDPAKANAAQKKCIDMLKIVEGDILISRSGTIGKVTYATHDLANNYIVSDDLVRIRVKNPDLRAYLLAYFASSTALSLMLLDEYGSVQQHLQPRHIQEMLIPIPDDWRMAQNMIDAGNRFMQAMESMSQADLLIRDHGFDSMI